MNWFKDVGSSEVTLKRTKCQGIPIKSLECMDIFKAVIGRIIEKGFSALVRKVGKQINSNNKQPISI